MTALEIVAVVVTAIGVISFSLIFTILYSSYVTSAVSEIEAGKRDLDIIDEAIYERGENVKRRKTFFKGIRRVLFWLALIIIVPTFAFAVYSRIKGGVPMFGGKGVMVVASGSMSQKNPKNEDYLVNYDNQFDTYDMIILEKVEKSSELKKYDVIAFVNDEGTNIIHRIIDIEYGSGGVRYVTRGDSNDADDKYRPTFDDVLGRYVNKRVPLVGVFVMFLQSYSGIITICALAYCLLMVDKKTEKLRIAFAERQETLDSAIRFDEITSVDDLKPHFTEIIYYKGFAYTFGEKGFVEKAPILDKAVKERSQQTVIKKHVTDEEGSVEEITLTDGD